MAFLKIENVKISGIAACVPPKRVDNMKRNRLNANMEGENAC